VRLLHELAKIHATFDDPHLVSQAGLVPVMALAERAGLGELTAEHVRISRPCGVNSPVKIGCLVAGMTAGADSTGDMGLLRHGAMPVLFGGIRAPSTLGSFLRAFTWGNVPQLQKVHRQFLAELARRAPLLPGAEVLAFTGIDSQQKRVYGHAKQGAAFGFTKIQGKGLLVRGLNVLATTICTPLSAPVIAGTRLRGGNASSARAAAPVITEAVTTARASGCTGTLVVRMDPAFYGAAAVAAARNAGAHFSVTVRTDPRVRLGVPQQRPGALAVLDRGGGDHHVQDQAHHVSGDMALAAVDLLGVVPAPAGTGDGVRGPDGLGVDDGGSGLGLAAGSGPDQGAQLGVQPG
jgi:hypothetical protein